MIKTSRQKYYFFLLVLLAFALRIPLITADAPGGDPVLHQTVGGAELEMVAHHRLDPRSMHGADNGVGL